VMSLLAGIFWISLEDLCTYFTSIAVAKVRSGVGCREVLLALLPTHHECFRHGIALSRRFALAGRMSAALCRCRCRCRCPTSLRSGRGRRLSLRSHQLTSRHRSSSPRSAFR
jgi:hypothetical protein